MKILITGATSGFGKAMAEKFAAGGHELWITGRRQEKLQSVSKTLSGQYHHDIRITAVDVRKKTEVQLLAKDIQERWGYVDVLMVLPGDPDTTKQNRQVRRTFNKYDVILRHSSSLAQVRPKTCLGQF